jgi:hypothetical protein
MQEGTWREPSFAGRIGVARRDITPPAGIFARSWGPTTWDVPTGVHRPLTLTALAIDAPAPAQPLVLVAVDLGWFQRREDEWVVRGALLERLGLDPARVLVHLSHTHAGPSTSTADAEQPGGQLIAPYLDAVATAAVDAAVEALGAARPATLQWHTGRCDLAGNRDLPDGDRVLVGFNPARHADDTVLVGRVTDEVGDVLATLVNYACHPTTLAWENTLISPDFPGAMREVVERATGGAPCLFLQGASGELAPPEQYSGDVAVADRHGRQLGHAAVGCLEAMLAPGHALARTETVESGAPLAVWAQRPQPVSDGIAARIVEVEVGLKALPTLEELAARWKGINERSLAERLRRAQAQFAQYRPEARSTIHPVWLWTLGDVAVVAHPGEAYSWLQTELRARHPARAVVALNVTNGVGPYLPRREIYAHDAYPAWQSVFEPGCLEVVVDEVDRALRGAEAGADTAPAY